MNRYTKPYSYTVRNPGKEVAGLNVHSKSEASIRILRDRVTDISDEEEESERHEERKNTGWSRDSVADGDDVEMK